MSVSCPVDLDTVRLRREVAAMYGRVATNPGGSFHFHRGPAYAAEFLGYDVTTRGTAPGGKEKET